MKTYLYIFILISIINPIFGQRKTTEYNFKNITGYAVGGANMTPEQVKQKAINNAKINAMQKAGIEENISSYSDYFRSESDGTMDELFTSDILSNINGTVKKIELVKATIGTTPEGQIKYDVIINCTVVRYKTKSDLTFNAWIDGVKPVYKEGEGLSFTIKPTINCFVRAFVFTDDSYVLLPNEYEKSFMLLANNTYSFPNKAIVDSYEMTIDNPQKKKELNRLVIILLKRDIFYTGDVNYKDITDWIMSIPPDERLINSFAYEVYKE